MREFKIMLSLILVLFVFNLNAQELGQFRAVRRWDELLEMAQKEKKMIFIDCYTESCVPCKKMDKEVFPLEQVKKLMIDSFICVKFDCRKEKLGEYIYQKFWFSSFPTYIFLKNDGSRIDMVSGYQNAEQLIKLLRNAIAVNKE